MIGTDRGRKIHLQHPVPLLPVDSGMKLHHASVFAQTDELRQQRILNSAFQAPCGTSFKRILRHVPAVRIQNLFLLFVHAADLPGIIVGIHIPVQPESIHGLSSGFPALRRFFLPAANRLQADHLSRVIQTDDERITLQQEILSFAQPFCSALRCSTLRLSVFARSLLQLCEDFIQQALARLTDIKQLLFRFFMHTSDSRSGKHIVKFLHEQPFPERTQRFCPLQRSCPVRSNAESIPVFRFLQQAFRPAYAQLCFRLRRIGSPVPGQIQLSGKYILTAAFLKLFKIGSRAFECRTGRTFQILTAFRRLHQFPGRSASSVSIAVGIDHSFYSFVLNPVILPPADHVSGRKRCVILLISMRQDFRTINSLPPEIVIGKRLALRILADHLLCSEIRNPALCKNLRQSGRKTEAVRQPAHTAVRTHLLLEPLFSIEKLSYKTFSAGHVRVAFHIEGSVGNHFPFRRLLLHPLPELRIGFLQIFQDRRLAQQELIIRIFLHQRQLIAVGSRRLASGLLQCPKPGQIQMGLTENGEFRRSGAIGAGKQRL